MFQEQGIGLAEGGKGKQNHDAGGDKATLIPAAGSSGAIDSLEDSE